VIIDTGSYLTAFPCSDCGDDCGTHINPKFDLEASSTNQKITCNDDLFSNYNCKNRCN